MANAKELKEKLYYVKENGRKSVSDDTLNKSDAFCENYKQFLGASKTERQFVKNALKLAKENGFSEFDCNKNYKSGDKVFYNNRNKALILAIIGKRNIAEGTRISAAHIDSPRLDLKQNPLYEDSDIALLKTHYYGGIRKYQWPVMPLSLQGVIAKKDGTVIDINIGEDPNDPCFVVTDLLPHLSAEQSKRTLSEGIKGEELNIIVGSHPFKDDEESELVKLNILKILNEKYGITEEDFLSAELEAVPQYMPKDIGFDRSMIGAYGHDDRVCAYPALMAILNAETPEYTAITVLTDKEETGSDGNTGLNSSYLKYFIEDLAKSQNTYGYRVLRNSMCLSADVNAAFDPTFPNVMEKRNASFINKGVVITKYTGARGKYDTSDASAEYVAKIRAMLDNANIVWQIGELGKVDEGGGGTVAKYIAALDVDVIDLGVPVLAMHSPFEIVAKFDVYMAYLAFSEFFK